jgi:proteasome lid subunit RPN8/RPN11
MKDAILGGIGSPLESVAITQEVKEAMEAHALEARPAECCGLLAGDGRVITSLYRLRNEADKPETRYFASPEDLLAAMRKIRQEEQTMMGIYHSHPKSPAYPSKSDVELAFYSDAIYVILSLEPRVEMRAFRIDNGGIDSVPLLIVEDSQQDVDV